jgi:hypothetical protein
LLIIRYFFFLLILIASDEKIIVFGGNKDDIATPVLNPLAVLNTKVVPYEWSVPTPAPPLPLTTNLHSATLVENYMFINFGKLINSYSVFFLRSKLNTYL